MQEVINYDRHVIYFTLTDTADGFSVVGFRLFNDRTLFESVEDFIGELWAGPDLVQAAIAA